MALTNSQLFAINKRLVSAALNYEGTTRANLCASIGKLLPSAMQPITQKPYRSKKQLAWIYCVFKNSTEHLNTVMTQMNKILLIRGIEDLLREEQSVSDAEDCNSLMESVQEAENERILKEMLCRDKAACDNNPDDSGDDGDKDPDDNDEDDGDDPDDEEDDGEEEEDPEEEDPEEEDPEE